MFYVIMPVYNTERYLREAIDSVINQTLSFEENVILHFVDDASTDGSLAVCESYKERYPNNIVLTHFEENKGVSAARNFAVSKCLEREDRIACFVDSDDKIAPDYLEKVQAYFEKHEDINIATAEIHYFEAVEKPHKLNWRFEEKEVVNIKKDFNYPQYYIGGAFFRRSALKGLKFDESMSFWEDALAVNQVILGEGKYGLIKEAKYYYRKRADESSLVNQAWQSEERYTSFLEEGYLQLMNYCRKKKWRVIPYIQFVIAYHLRVFLMKSKSEVVGEVLDSEDELAEFRERLQVILKKISVDVIISLPTSLPIIEAMLSMRKGKQVRVKKVYTENDCLMTFKGKVLAKMSERSVKLFHILEEPEFEGMWRGRFATPIYAMRVGDYIFAEHNGEMVKAQEYPCGKQLFILGKRLRCYFHAGFAIDIPKDWDRAVFGIYMAEGNTHIRMNEIVFDEVEQIHF